MQKPTLEERVLFSASVQESILRLGKASNGQFESAQDACSYFLAEACQGFEQLKAGHNASAMLLGRFWTWYIDHLTFAGAHIAWAGQAKKSLRNGRTLVVSAHDSYFDVPVLVHHLNSGSRNFYLGGENVIQAPGKDAALSARLKAQFLAWLFRENGQVRMRRKITGEELLHAKVMSSYSAELLRDGNNIVIFSGEGRSRQGGVQPFKSAYTPSFMNGAEQILPVKITYTIIPEDEEFALNKAKGRSSVSSVFHYQRLDRGYGKLYIAFGAPISMERYREIASTKSQYEAETRLQADVTAALIKNTFVTPINATAAAIARLAAEGGKVELYAVLKNINSIISEANLRGGHVAPCLLQDNRSPISQALRYFTGKEALQLEETKGDFLVKVKDPRLLQFYSNTITPTLELLVA